MAFCPLFNHTTGELRTFPLFYSCFYFIIPILPLPFPGGDVDGCTACTSGMVPWPVKKAGDEQLLGTVNRGEAIERKVVAESALRCADRFVASRSRGVEKSNAPDSGMHSAILDPER